MGRLSPRVTFTRTLQECPACGEDITADVVAETVPDTIASSETGDSVNVTMQATLETFTVIHRCQGRAPANEATLPPEGGEG